jgi:glycosyltransferase involved in cell wall biosynthesis
MPNPVISIATGTYNRLPHLQRMVASVRATLPAGLTYEFVICDGGSTDGTLEWLRGQPDVRLIEHGELRGALRAFGDAARAATGDYVVLANDDIAFHRGGLVAAVAHLEAHPACGAVAFADNRLAPGYGTGYKVQTIQARRGGQPVAVTYPQVGMVRRWLGDALGWWGDLDPVMGNGATYGGDSWLGARIWEAGYTVDAVDACVIDDFIPADGLRQHNYAVEKRNPGVYYKAYPNGPDIPDAPQFDNRQVERLRVLYLPLYEPSYGRYKHGLRDALSEVALVYEWDYLSEPGDLAELCRWWQPHVLLTQLHSAERITEAHLAAARAAAPEMVVVNWNGDVWGHGLTTPDMLSLLRHVDLQLTVNATVNATYRDHGIRAAYWQVAFEPVDDAVLPVVAAHDVVFLANAYSPERKRLGAILQAMSGIDVGLYGFGWSNASGSTTYNFAAGAALYQRAKIALGDNQYPDQHGFVSNRIFEALAHGAFLLHQHVPGLDDLTGLRAGTHYVEWSDTDDLQRQIRKWLQPRYEAQRRAIAEAGRAYVREHHSFQARVRELFEVLLPMAEDEHVAYMAG